VYGREGQGRAAVTHNEETIASVQEDSRCTTDKVAEIVDVCKKLSTANYLIFGKLAVPQWQCTSSSV
jgi:hypothetical protein